MLRAMQYTAFKTQLHIIIIVSVIPRAQLPRSIISAIVA